MTDAANSARAAAAELRQLVEDAGLDPASASDGEIGAAIDSHRQAREAASVVGSGTPRRFGFEDNQAILDLFESRNVATFAVGMGRQWLDELRDDAAESEALAGEWAIVTDWFTAKGHPVPADGAIPTGAYALWTRGIERFLIEGKAPSPALRRVFDAFRTWLLDLYRVVEELDAPIAPEIREVMQRLFATGEEIAEASERQHLLPLFADAAQAGMSEADFAAYQMAAADAGHDAHDALLHQAMASVRRVRTRAWKSEAAGVRAEAAVAIDARPVFRALDLLRTGRVRGAPDVPRVRVKLDRAWLVREYGTGVLALLPGVHADADTTDADEVAERTGFATGDALVRTLLTIEQDNRHRRDAGDDRPMRRVLVDALTAAEMHARHGDLFTDGAIEEAALAAVHNDARGEVIASELRALARRGGPPPMPYALARQWAAAKIAESQVDDALSGSTIQLHARAAAKTAAAAAQALHEKDQDEAFRQKQAQLLNNALVAEAGRMRDAVSAARDRLAAAAAGDEAAAIEPSYQDQIDGLLEQVDLRDPWQRAPGPWPPFEEWARARDAEGYDLVVPPSFAASLGDAVWSRLTVAQLIALDGIVAQIAQIGRQRLRMIDGGQERDVAALVDKAVAGIANIPERPVVDADFLDPSYPAESAACVLGPDAAMRKMDVVFGWLDHGNADGLFSRVIAQRLAAARAQRKLRLRRVTDKLAEARARIPAEIRARWSRKVELGLIDPRTGRPAILTGEQLVVMAMNVGNAAGLRALSEGFGWNADAILAALGHELQPEEWRYVQHVWDVIGTLSPDIAALARRVNGVAPDPVEPQPVPTAHGDLPGGWFPLVYDPAHAAPDATGGGDAVFAMGYRRATARDGGTGPILFSMSVLDRHIGEIIHDITHREAVIDAYRLLDDPQVAAAIRDLLGAPVQQQLVRWLRQVANDWAFDAAGTVAMAKAVTGMRTNATFAGFAGHASALQMRDAGLFGMARAIGGQWLVEGIRRVAQHPVDAAAFASAASPTVAERLMDGDSVLHGASGAVANEALFRLHMAWAVERFVTVAGWIGAYNRALSEGRTERQAVDYADTLVHRLPGVGAAQESIVGDAGILLTMFYAYQAAFNERQRMPADDDDRDVAAAAPGDLPALLAHMLELYVCPALAAELLAGGGPADDADWTGWIQRTLDRAALGPVAPASDGAGGAGPGPAFTAIGGIGRKATTLWDEGRRLWALEQVMVAPPRQDDAATQTGITADQAAAATRFLFDLTQGDPQPETFGEWYRELLRGDAWEMAPGDEDRRVEIESAAPPDEADDAPSRRLVIADAM